MSYIVGMNDASAGRIGNKAQRLAELRRVGFDVPAFFVVTPDAFAASLDEDQRRAFAAGQYDFLESLVVRSRVLQAIAEALDSLCADGVRVAVRSSSAEEDDARNSFAGQLDSFLGVQACQVPAYVSKVWRSAFSGQAEVYRAQRGIALPPRVPAVMVQRMANAQSAGVCFSADPVSGRRGIAVVSAVHGLGDALVNGKRDGDLLHIDRSGKIIERQTAEKPAVTDEQARQIAEIARNAARHYDRPQDIEWAIEDDRVVLLQSRDITTLSSEQGSGDGLKIWDNSNIVESYGGVTLPLTFSVARRAYSAVYKRLGQIVGVPAAVIAEHDGVYDRLLGLIRGRVYYNLLNWYRLLALLPGVSSNRLFMEQMMGVRDALPDDLLARLSHSGWWAKLNARWQLLRSGSGLLFHYLLRRRDNRRFYRRLESALAPVGPALESLRLDQLANHYQSLHAQLVRGWDAPLLNDLYCMIFHGLLQRLVMRWLPDAQHNVRNDLLCGVVGMVSLEPVRRMRTMARMARRHPKLVRTLCDESLASIWAEVSRYPELGALLREYLERFGDRCIDELKLESPTLHDEPLPLLRAVGHLARRDGVSCASTTAHTRRVAEDAIHDGLWGRLIRQRIFQYVLGQARAHMRDRENMRFERTRVYGRVRRIFLEMAQRLCAADALEKPHDIFYLDVEQILGFIDGTAAGSNLKALARVRRLEFDEYRNAPTLPNRFETRGAVNLASFSERGSEPEGAALGEERKGLGCCSGTVEGIVRVVRDPNGTTVQPGEILVAEHTDPGWVILFPLAAGLLVERGSLLSHSAIVARELGLPTVVAVRGLTKWLRNGDRVRLDGSTGVIRRLDSARRREAA